jgi:hypothetical protein
MNHVTVFCLWFHLRHGFGSSNIEEKKNRKKQKQKKRVLSFGQSNVSLKSEDAPSAEVMASAVQSCCKYDHLSRRFMLENLCSQSTKKESVLHF